MNGIHDVGGMDGFGPVQKEENEPVFHEPWEGRVRAMSTLISSKCRIITIHESRSVTERVHPVYYLASGYYQRWMLRMETVLIQKGVFTEEELQEKMAQIDPLSSFKPDLEPYRKVLPHNPSTQRRFVIPPTVSTKQEDEPIKPKFSPGTLVKVKEMSLLGHTRAPRYVRGKQGVIEEIHGNFILPDLHAQKGIDLYQPVYRVCFKAQDLWGEDAYSKDKLLIEMWEDYLELGGN